MKKFKKIFAMCLATVMAMSVMCVGVSANEVHQLKNGVTLTTYSEGEIVPRANLVRTVDATFNTTIAKYPSSTLVGNNLSLGSQESNIEITFTKAPSSSYYISLYDLTTDEYLTSGTNYLFGPIGKASTTFTLGSLTGGHSYRIRIANLVSSCSVAGTITSY